MPHVGIGVVGRRTHVFDRRPLLEYVSTPTCASLPRLAFAVRSTPLEYSMPPRLALFYRSCVNQPAKQLATSTLDTTTNNNNTTTTTTTTTTTNNNNNNNSNRQFVNHNIKRRPNTQVECSPRQNVSSRSVVLLECYLASIRLSALSVTFDFF